jgi:cysteine-rich repeat protein
MNLLVAPRVSTLLAQFSLFGTLLCFAATAQAVIVATTADDICAPEADPCVIQEAVEATSGAVFDFGLRDVSIVDAGTLVFDRGGTIRCGDFSSTPNSTSLASGGTVRIEARRACAQDTDRFCARNSNCDSGPCQPRRCTLTERAEVSCGADGDCDGLCVENRCNNAPDIPCFLNTRCKFGTCEAQRRCDDENSLFCDADADCDFGPCSAGTGNFLMGTRVNSNAANPGNVFFTAAGSLTIDGRVTINSEDTESDGGSLILTSEDGPVRVNGKIALTGGGQSTGGELTVQSGGDVVFLNDVDASGGDFDGGVIEVTAGGDITVGGELNVNATAGAGFGGEVLLIAGQDVIFLPGTDSKRIVSTADGHTDSDNFSGDGGLFELEAGRAIEIGAFVEISAFGAAPNSDGGEVTLASPGDISIQGDIILGSRGLTGGGGRFCADAGGTLTVAPSGFLDVRGNRGGGGSIDLVVDGDTFLNGTSRAGGATGFSAGTFLLRSLGDLTAGGEISNAGTSRGDAVQIHACRATFTPGSSIANSAVDGLNLIEVGESSAVAIGASLVANGGGGENRFVYRDAAKPPLLLGTISPTAKTVLNATLPGCPVCGNGELDEGELCDDANTADGDGCNSDCIDEGCLAESPNYPSEPLCSDGSACTLDSCDTEASACVNEFLCSDVVACTDDLCVDDECVSQPDDASCSDGDICTDDICVAEVGCANPTNTLECDDATFCTQDDRCDAGSCVGVAKDCDDGVACTMDSCSEGEARCLNVPSDLACGNGLFCDGVETCNVVSGCEDASVVDCSDFDDTCLLGECDEAGDACVGLARNEGGSCDDADFCTENDQCAAGECSGGLLPDCGVCGNGRAEPEVNEQCDDGDAVFEHGEACSAICRFVGCGKPTGSGGLRPSAADALFTLRSAVQLATCVASVCDADGNGSVFAADALVILQAAVGLPVTLACPDAL